MSEGDPCEKYLEFGPSKSQEMPRDAKSARSAKSRHFLISKRISGVDCNGDDIRRVAGTVGTVSPLFKIKESFQVSRPGTCLLHAVAKLIYVSLR